MARTSLNRRLFRCNSINTVCEMKTLLSAGGSQARYNSCVKFCTQSMWDTVYKGEPEESEEDPTQEMVSFRPEATKLFKGNFNFEYLFIFSLIPIDVLVSHTMKIWCDASPAWTLPSERKGQCLLHLNFLRRGMTDRLLARWTLTWAHLG